MNSIYYLETSSLIRLSRWLVDNREISQAICYTSFLSVFELLSGMTKRKYAQRVGVLKKLKVSAIPINWNTPREIIAESFAVVLVRDKLRHRIQRLCALAMESASFGEFTKSSAETRDAISLEELCGMDVTITLGHSKEVQNQISQMRTEVPPEKIKKACDLLAGSQTFRDSLARQSRSEELRRLAIYVAMNMPGAKSEESLLRILRSYNGRIDRFLKADSFRQAERLLKGETPARNDFFDVSHLLYLTRDDQIMVTDDDLLLSICGQLFPTNCSTSADFLTRYQ